MNVKRFTARTSREALALVKGAFGADAVVMSTRPCPEGVEVVAMASESVMELERVGAAAAPAAPASPVQVAATASPRQPSPASWTAPVRPAAARIAAATRQAATQQPPAAWSGAASRQRLEPSMDPEPHQLPAWATENEPPRPAPAAPRTARTALADFVHPAAHDAAPDAAVQSE